MRLLYLLSLSDTPNLFDRYKLDDTEGVKSFVVPPEDNGILGETIALLPFKKDLVGFRVDQNDCDTTVTLLVKNEDGKLTKISVEVGEKEKAEIAKFRKSKRILIAVEGGIAGHAVRTLETARGLRNLGYEPAIVGSGYYACFFLDEGFNCLSPFNSDQTQEKDRIIAQARGEGKGLFFWGFGRVKKGVASYKSSLRDYVQAGIDLFLCDMNPIVDIAVESLQKETGQSFPKLTETHDVRLSSSRTLRAIKIKNLPVGELFYKMNHSRVLSILDPLGLRSAATHLLFSEIADLVMGLPLLAQDRLHGGKKSRMKFTDYLYGRDGTVQFCFRVDNDDSKVYPVGLQADRGKADGSDQDDLEDDIPREKAFILNTQGSTYHKGAWNAVVSALAGMPDCFSVHTTGVKEDKRLPIYNNQAGQEQELVGYRVGYVDGFRLSRMTNLMINHGGFGTISQWLLATAERIQEERRVLDKLVHSQEESALFLNSCRSVPRSLSICNTFEQENNALSLNEIGGNNVCTVITADNLLKSRDPQKKIRQMIGQLLTNQMDDQERQFWLNLVKYESTMNAPVHAALILERIMMDGRKED